ncbi:MAG: efflux RND transporter periplasmic adaptor subunit [Azospira oryzae]|nr:MAG: efflux RND transporter periplasmic adaptor subunit [Azospira oryzae]PZP77260.1 MAG: efflux RND transporter periplasmic adaptor subunit [Azospira oryzae]
MNHSTLTYATKLLLALGALTLVGCGNADPTSVPKPAPVAGREISGAAGDASSQATDHDEQPTLRLTPEQRQANGIKVEPLRFVEAAERVVVTATIQPNQDRLFHVAPRAAGRITQVFARLGDRVKRGQVLATLDSIEVGQAHSVYLQAESELSLAQANFERAQRLHAEQIIPEKDYLRARADYETALAKARAAADRLRLLGVAPAKTAQAQSVFPLRSPYAGTVIEKHAVLGELADPKESLFTIADLSIVWIEANLAEKDLGKVRVGAPARVSVAAYPDEVFEGRVTYVSSVMDKETRTVRARVEVPNPDDRLKAQMFATVAIESKTRTKVMLIPKDAVTLLQGQPIVFVEEREGFEPRAVRLGESTAGGVVVHEGLKEGDTVVVSGAYTLKSLMLKSQLGAGHGH